MRRPRGIDPPSELGQLSARDGAFPWQALQIVRVLRGLSCPADCALLRGGASKIRERTLSTYYCCASQALISASECPLLLASISAQLLLPSPSPPPPPPPPFPAAKPGATVRARVIPAARAISRFFLMTVPSLK